MKSILLVLAFSLLLVGCGKDPVNPPQQGFTCPVGAGCCTNAQGAYVACQVVH